MGGWRGQVIASNAAKLEPLRLGGGVGGHLDPACQPIRRRKLQKISEPAPDLEQRFGVRRKLPEDVDPPQPVPPRRRPLSSIVHVFRAEVVISAVQLLRVELKESVGGPDQRTGGALHEIVSPEPSCSRGRAEHAHRRRLLCRPMACTPFVIGCGRLEDVPALAVDQDVPPRRMISSTM